MTLKRYFKMFTCSAALLLVPSSVATSVNAQVPPGVFVRTLHMAYAIRDNAVFQGNADPDLNHTDQQLANAIDLVKTKGKGNGITAIIPFFLNVTNVAKFKPMLDKIVTDRGIVIVPGVGGDPDDGVRLDNQKYKTMADNVHQWTDYIRLENLQGYLDRGSGGKAAIQSMIDYLTGEGWKHIMMNPWPVDSSGQPVHFLRDGALDSTIYQVSLKKVARGGRPNCPDHSADANNWGLPANSEITNMHTYKPSVKILINYESAPQHQSLACDEEEHPGASKADMDKTATAIEDYTYMDLHWNPPFTPNYDPLKYGTWDWEAARIADF